MAKNNTRNRKIVELGEAFVKSKIQGDPGHDYLHCDRVRNIALAIARREKGDLDLFVIEIAALFHDIADHKFSGDDQISVKLARKFLKKMKVSKKKIDHICFIIDHISFSGDKGGATRMTTEEGKIVQDADRLDAMGATGIARTFSYGGAINRKMYTNATDYETIVKTTIGYLSKVLINKYKKVMNTKTAKKMMLKRIRTMVYFLKAFSAEVAIK